MDAETEKAIEQAADKGADRAVEAIKPYFDEKVEEVKRHMDVRAEDLEKRLSAVAEGVDANGERLDRIDQRLEKMEGADLDTRVRILEQQAEKAA
jgi:hypothetical protein